MNLNNFKPWSHQTWMQRAGCVRSVLSEVASWTRVGSVAAGSKSWREFGTVDGSPDTLGVCGGVRGIRNLGLGEGDFPLASKCGVESASSVSPQPVRFLGEMEWPERGPPGRGSLATCSECCLGDRTWNRRSQVQYPRPAPVSRLAAGQLCLGLGSPDICGLPSPAPPLPGLSSEWRAAGLLVCGGRREEIEEWF